MIAIDTNVVVRFLVADDPAQHAASTRLLREHDVFVPDTVVIETEWVLRSRYKLDKQSIASAFAQLLESGDVEFEHEPTVEETLHLWSQQARADFADCLLSARAVHLGRSRFLTFDVGASKLPRAELMS